MRGNLTEHQRQHIIELLERGRELPHAALGGQRSEAPRVRSSPERDFALFDAGVQCCALRPPAPVEVGEAGRQAAFVCAWADVGYNRGGPPPTAARTCAPARWMRR
jgi:hypothetical protein